MLTTHKGDKTGEVAQSCCSKFSIQCFSPWCMFIQGNQDSEGKRCLQIPCCIICVQNNQTESISDYSFRKILNQDIHSTDLVPVFSTLSTQEWKLSVSYLFQEWKISVSILNISSSKFGTRYPQMFSHSFPKVGSRNL